jgi:tetratricopeptide (TPR) repeat protein
LFRETPGEQQRITITLEMMRILENRLVYLQNFTVDPTSESRMLARLVTEFIEQVTQNRTGILTTLEATYYGAVAALYAGDLEKARTGFAAACASEESDETNDIKYKSYVILGHVSHQDADYAGARELHDRSMQYSANDNVTAQALALKALNCYALQDLDEALRLFEQALTLFDEAKPFFNSYFHRNALSFCGAIHFDRRELDTAETYYRQVMESVDQSSFDYFDALSHIGRICYLQQRFDDAVNAFQRAVQSHRANDNEYVVDTWFWLARCHLKLDERGTAREYLEKIAATDVRYEKKPQAVELLQRIA